MKAFFARVRAELGYWGTRLNIIAAGAAAYVAANGGQVQATIDSLVGQKWRAPALGLISLVSFLIVNEAALSDRKKASGNG